MRRVSCVCAKEVALVMSASAQSNMTLENNINFMARFLARADTAVADTRFMELLKVGLSREGLFACREWRNSTTVRQVHSRRVE